ncbi:hypothetical protein DKL61_05530 [Gammaproteobacteria bacterium ESL0073]|nr:hypothetical protein DKL61_05530 [Gammaproteobacteria bacterium ESL0073]
MIQHKNRTINKLLGSLLFFFSIHSWAAGVGSDANPSSIGTTFTAFYSPTPQVIASRTPYGGRVCSLSSSTNGFTSASAKWRSPNIAGTMSYDGYTYEIQRTNISGIGAIVRLGAQFTNSSYAQANTVIGSQYKTITATTSSGAQNVFFGIKYWALVTIPGEPLVPGTYSLSQSETMVDVWCQAVTSNNDAHGGGYMSGTIVINAPTCSLGSDISSIITLDLGQHQWIDVRNLSVGSNFGSVSKSLSMQCQAGAWPKLLVSDKNNNNNHSTIVSLTNPSASSTAQGVGVQLFINNQSTPQQLATKVSLAPAKLTKETTIELPLQFKYIKTSESVSTGEANAIIELTFTYD